MTREELFRAIGEVREDQIEAAEIVKKQVHPWRWFGALAACLALVATAAAVPQIRGQVQWKSLVKSFNPAVITDSGGEAAGGGLDGSDYWTDGTARSVSYSVGVEIAETQWTGTLEPPKTSMDYTPSPGLQRLEPETPEELLGEDTLIFRGTVRELRYHQITSGDDQALYTVASVEVTDCIRGDLTEGEIYHILYTGHPGHMPSISENLGYLQVGSDAIFMPIWANPEAGWITEDGFFAYIDLADMYFDEGLRFLFLDTGDGLVFERSVYPDIVDAKTLDEITAYIREQLKLTKQRNRE